MKMRHTFCMLIIASLLLTPLSVFAEQQAEMIVGKMATKFTRGVANTFTSIVELPKQMILTPREMGPQGYVVGPIKGLGMTLYRGFIGVTETVFCFVPQPGYYDPMIDPAYVWEGWESKRDTSPVQQEEKQ